MRFLLLPLLLLSLSFACDQPYEEVYGIKIGCIFEPTPDFKIKDRGYEKIYQSDGDIEVATKRVLTLGDKARSLTIEFFVKNDFKDNDLLKQLRSRWGDGEVLSSNNSNDVYTVMFNETNNDIVSAVFLDVIGSNEYKLIKLNYFTPEYDKYLTDGPPSIDIDSF